MSDELISQLISGGVGVIIALAVLGIVWRSPEFLRAIQGVLAQIMETANTAAERIEQANERLTVSNSTLLASLQESQNLAKDSLDRWRGLETRVTEMDKQSKEKDILITQQLSDLTESTKLVSELEKAKVNLEQRVDSLEEVRDILTKRITYLETELKIAYEAGNTEATVGLADDLAGNKDELVEAEKKLDDLGQ